MLKKVFRVALCMATLTFLSGCMYTSKQDADDTEDPGRTESYGNLSILVSDKNKSDEASITITDFDKSEIKSGDYNSTEEGSNTFKVEDIVAGDNRIVTVETENGTYKGVVDVKAGETTSCTVNVITTIEASVIEKLEGYITSDKIDSTIDKIEPIIESIISKIEKETDTTIDINSPYIEKIVDAVVDYIINGGDKTFDVDKFVEDLINGDKEKTLESITLDTTSVKKEYKQGEVLSLEGLKVTAKYNDGTSSDLDSDKYKVYLYNDKGNLLDEAKALSSGEFTVKVKYEGKVDSYTITVVKNLITITSIEVEDFPLSYTEGDVIDTNITVTINYSNGSTEEVTTGYTVKVDGEDYKGEKLTSDNKKVTIEYAGVEETFDITVAPKVTVESIEVKGDIPTSYTEGDVIDTNITVVVKYSDGSTEEKVSDFTVKVDGKDYKGEALTTDNKTITVIYEGVEKSYDITVSPKTDVILKSISVNWDKSITYTAGDKFGTDLTLVATYSDGSTKTITEGYEVKLDDVLYNGETLTPGDHKVTVSYEGKSDSYTITVNSVIVVIESIKVVGDIKTSYVEGDILDTKYTVEVTYSDGSTKTITEGYEVTLDGDVYNGDPLTKGSHTVAINYIECSPVTVTIDVEGKIIPPTDSYYMYVKANMIPYLWAWEEDGSKITESLGCDYDHWLKPEYVEQDEMTNPSKWYKFDLSKATVSGKKLVFRLSTQWDWTEEDGGFTCTIDGEYVVGGKTFFYDSLTKTGSYKDPSTGTDDDLRIYVEATSAPKIWVWETESKICEEMGYVWVNAKGQDCRPLMVASSADLYLFKVPSEYLAGGPITIKLDETEIATSCTTSFKVSGGKAYPIEK